MKIEDILRAGSIPKDERKAIKIELSKNGSNAKKRELLKNELFATAKTLMASGAQAATVLDGLEDLLRLLDGSEETSNLGFKIGFSPGKDCKNLIISHLMGAKKSLQICVFTISDNDIADCIIRLHQNHIDVKLVSDNEKAADEGSDIKRMADAGIPIKIDYTTNHMHHKFSVADGLEVLTGSYNWTRSAEQYNQENLLVMRRPDVATAYIKEFDRLWNSLVDF
jgi:phosphatidylserine/phosphatidylglycerophosphate/cardiolipin synthase-like enzyme